MTRHVLLLLITEIDHDVHGDYVQPLASEDLPGEADGEETIVKRPMEGSVEGDAVLGIVILSGRTHALGFDVSSIEEARLPNSTDDAASIARQDARSELLLSSARGALLCKLLGEGEHPDILPTPEDPSRIRARIVDAAFDAIIATRGETGPRINGCLPTFRRLCRLLLWDSGCPNVLRRLA